MRGLPEERAVDLIEKLRSHGHAAEPDLIVQIRDG